LKEAVYVDSNVFILPVLGEKSERARGARTVLERVESGELLAYTSILTWDELVWVVSKVLGRTDGIQAGRKLLNFPGLRLIDVTAQVVSRAQTMLESYRLAPRDAVHCASALTRGLSTLVSDDRGLDVVAELRRSTLESFSSTPR